MEKEELEAYEYQLSQVKATLQRDPQNTEMLNLKEELENLIALTRDYLAAQSGPSTAAATASASNAGPTAGPSKPKEKAKPAGGYGRGESKAEDVGLKAGDACMAKFKEDGKWYPAKITTIGGSSDTRIYTIVFKGYTSTELVSSSEIKPMTDTKKRALEREEEEAEKERKRKKNEKKTESKAAKAAEQNSKQKSWQDFAKKGAKKGVNIPGMSGESIFASPTTASGKVGVVGSGKGMTEYGTKQRHKFGGS